LQTDDMDSCNETRVSILSRLRLRPGNSCLESFIINIIAKALDMWWDMIIQYTYLPRIVQTKA